MLRCGAAVGAIVVLVFFAGYGDLCDCGVGPAVERAEASAHSDSCHDRKPVQRKGPCSGNACCGHCVMNEKVAVNNAVSKPVLDRTLLDEQPIGSTSNLQVDERPLWVSPYEKGEADYFPSHIIIFAYFPQAPPSVVG